MIAELTNRVIGPNDAVMFDIDETLIHRDGTPIPKIINLLQMCKCAGYKVVIMTARPLSKLNVEFTKEQLASFKIPYNFLMFISADDKTKIKRQLNLKFILSVGDQITDIGASTYWIKLPQKNDPKIYTNISSGFRNSYK